MVERYNLVKLVTAAFPSGVEYEIDPGSFEEWVESDVVGQRRFNDITGASRPATEPRAEIRTWRVDDWSLGEGYKFLDSTPGHPSQRGYYRSTEPVDIRLPGQFSQGLDAQSSLNSTGTGTRGPYLAVAGGKMFVADGDFTFGMKYQDPVDTWNDIGGAVDCDGSRGNASPHHSGVFTANGSNVHRVTTGGATLWTNEDGIAPLAADGRITYSIIGANSSTLERAGLDAAAAGSTVATFNGVGTNYAGAPIQSVAVGSRVYTLLANAGESPRLWVLEGTVAREVHIFDGLRVNVGDPGEQQMCVVNNVVYVCGWEVSTTTALEIARLDYFDGVRGGTVRTLEHRDTTSYGGDSRFTCIAPGAKNEVLLGERDTDRLTVHLWRYDTVTGSLSYFAEGQTSATPVRGCSAAYLNGSYYITACDSLNSVFRTKTSGASKYKQGVTIEMPIWDFDLPDTEKLLIEVELHCAPLPANTSVTIMASLDGATAIVLGTFSTTAGTRNKFVLSQATERTFRYLQPVLLLSSNDASGEFTPTIFSVTYRAIPLATRLRYFEFDVFCRDESATNRRAGAQQTGDAIATELAALRDSETDRVFTFQPLVKDSPSPHPGTGETLHTVIWAPGERNGHHRITAAGEGRFRVRLLKIS